MPIIIPVGHIYKLDGVTSDGIHQTIYTIVNIAMYTKMKSTERDTDSDWGGNENTNTVTHRQTRTLRRALRGVKIHTTREYEDGNKNDTHIFFFATQKAVLFTCMTQNGIVIKLLSPGSPNSRHLKPEDKWNRKLSMPSTVLPQLRWLDANVTRMYVVNIHVYLFRSIET